MATWGDPPILEFEPRNISGWFLRFEATLALNFATIQSFKHAILWETLPLELCCVLATPPPSDTPYNDLRAAVFTHYDFRDDLFQPAAG